MSQTAPTKIDLGLSRAAPGGGGFLFSSSPVGFVIIRGTLPFAVQGRSSGRALHLDSSAFPVPNKPKRGLLEVVDQVRPFDSHS